VGVTSAGEEERLLAMGDAFAARVVERAAPVAFRFADSPQDREAVYRLRYRTVVERGWADPAECPDGMERDGFDDRAVHLTGWAGEELAAVARLVFPIPGTLLPTEEAFGVRIEPAGRVADLSRTIVASRYRDPDHRVFLGLLARCWQEVRARGYVVACGDAADWLLDRYREMGLRIEVLGPPLPFWGEDRRPFRCDVLASTRAAVGRLSGRM